MLLLHLLLERESLRKVSAKTIWKSLRASEEEVVEAAGGKTAAVEVQPTFGLVWREENSGLCIGSFHSRTYFIIPSLSLSFLSLSLIFLNQFLTKKNLTLNSRCSNFPHFYPFGRRVFVDHCCFQQCLIDAVGLDSLQGDQLHLQLAR